MGIEKNHLISRPARKCRKNHIGYKIRNIEQEHWNSQKNQAVSRVNSSEKLRGRKSQKRREIGRAPTRVLQAEKKKQAEKRKNVYRTYDGNGKKPVNVVGRIRKRDFGLLGKIQKGET